MAFNLLDSVQSLLGSDFISQASSVFGEDEGRVKKAVSGIVPSVLTGILHKASSGDAHELLRLSKEATDSGIFSGASNFLGNNHLLARGADYVKALFGDRLTEVTSSLANFAGLRSSSISSIMSFAVPAALATLGRHAENTDMSAEGMVGLLNNQKEGILNSVPSGLNLAGALGIPTLAGLGTRLSNALSSFSGHSYATERNMAYTTEVRRRSSAAWVVPAILMLAGIGLLWYLLSGRKTSVTSETMNEARITDTTVSIPPMLATPPTIHESVKVMLPDGVEIDAYKGGIEDHLVAFLKDPNAKANKNTWFDFDNLNFETGSANITPESMKQVQNIVAILKSFPGASIKIGGYTDRTGNEPANMKLSQARADAVVTALKNNGVSSSQITGSEGYGSQFAKVPESASDEERRIDRRIAVSPRKK